MIETLKKTAVFDLDGVLAEYHGWPEDGSIGKPIQIGIELIFRLVEEGFNIVVQSCRTNRMMAGEVAAEIQYNLIRKWLDNNHLEFVKIWTEGKAMGVVYFDDRAIHIPLNWKSYRNSDYVFKGAIMVAMEAEK